MGVLGHSRLSKTVTITIGYAGKASDETKSVQYNRDAHVITEKLRHSLPSGTWDRVLRNMLEDYVAEYGHDKTIGDAYNLIVRRLLKTDCRHERKETNA